MSNETILTVRCDSAEGNNGLVKIHLTMVSAPSSQDEIILMNLLKSRMKFTEGRRYEVTLRELP